MNDAPTPARRYALSFTAGALLACEAAIREPLYVDRPDWMLYPPASRPLAIDLEDGVKANHPKFGKTLRTIPGLEAEDE